MHPTKSVYWDPVTVLGIDVKTPTGVTCQGTNARGDRCGNLVAMKDGRGNAIPYVMDLRRIPIDQVTEADLKPIAGWLMCMSWHRNDARKVNAKVADWFTKMDRFIASGMTRQMSKEETATAERLLQESLSMSAKLREQLKDSQRRLADQERECEQLENQNDILKGVNESLLAEKAATATLNGVLEQNLHRKAEKSRKQARMDAIEIARLGTLLEVRDLEIQKEKEKSGQLQGDVERSAAVIEAKDSEIDKLTQTLRDRAILHEKQVVDLRGELLEKDEALRKMGDLIRDTNATHQKEKNSAAIEIDGIKAERQSQKMKSYFQAMRSQVMLSMKQRKYNEVKADNEVLIEQHKTLQQAMSDIAVELQAAEVSGKGHILTYIEQRKLTLVIQRFISPLKMRSVKSGICTVLSFQPLRVRAQRLSEKRGPSIPAQSSSTAVTVK